MTCFICDPDNPDADPEGCEACEEREHAALMQARRPARIPEVKPHIHGVRARDIR